MRMGQSAEKCGQVPRQNIRGRVRHERGGAQRSAVAERHDVARINMWALMRSLIEYHDYNQANLKCW